MSANPSLQKKSAARMAAVQCLYTSAITGETQAPSEQITLLKDKLKNNRNEQKLLLGMNMEPNYPLAENLLAGVAAHTDDIDAQLDSILSQSWKRERMSPLLVAILQCGIFELGFGKDIKPSIVIDEYTRLARHFFSEQEVNFVHGALNKLAQK